MQERFKKSKYKDDILLATNQCRLFSELALEEQDTVMIDMYFHAAAMLAQLAHYLVDEELDAKMYKIKWENAAGIKENKE